MKRLIVGITGATGAVYGVRLLQAMREKCGQGEWETHVIVSDAAALVAQSELALSRADIEALARSVDHRFDGRLGHARVMLQFHVADVLSAAVVTHRADKGHDGADTRVARAQGRHLGREVEIGMAHGNTFGHLSTARPFRRY